MAQIIFIVQALSSGSDISTGSSRPSILSPSFQSGSNIAENSFETALKNSAQTRSFAVSSPITKMTSPSAAVREVVPRLLSLCSPILDVEDLVLVTSTGRATYDLQ